MTYTAGQLIQASDYNGFVTNNTNNVNAWWGTGSGNSGWGQTALGTVSAGDVIYAASWASLINTIKAAANHTGTSVTNRTAPAAGNTITIFPNVDTDIGSVNTNRGNAVASGSTNGSWSGTASVTSSTGAGNQNWTMTWTNTVTFGSSDQARYFFNAGGLVRIQMNKSSTGTTKDTFWNSLVSSAGSIFISGGIGASQSISGTSYTGVTVLGSSGSYTSNASAGWYYLLANGSTQIYQKTQTSSPYTSDTITVTAQASGATLTITVVWNSPGLSGQIDNSVSGGSATASPFSSFGSAPAVVVNTVYPSTTYLSNSWGTNSIAESVAVATSPGPTPPVFESLLVGAGGGGGSQGGGGGGGLVYRSSLPLPSPGQHYVITVGSGGAASAGSPTTASYGSPPGTITVYYGAPTAGQQGGTTTINAGGTIVSAYGGGAGGSTNTNPSATIGSAGGLPIFNGSTNVAGAVGTGGTTYYASNATGTSYHGGANQGAGGGGGGAGSAGTASITPNVQVGGNGYELWSGYGFAAGGGAGGYSSLGGNPFPSSGTYGGSNGSYWAGGRAGILAGDRSSGVYAGGYADAVAGAANSGSGGGGAAYGEVIYGMGAGTQAGNGGSGAVVIRYPGSSSLLQFNGTMTTSVSGGYVYHYIKSSGWLALASDPPLPPVPGPYGTSVIFAFGTSASSGQLSSQVSLMNSSGSLYSQYTSVATPRQWGAGYAYGGDKAILGYSVDNVDYNTKTNLVSNTGVVASDVTSPGTPRQYVTATGYGTDKAMFGFGYIPPTPLNIINRVSNTGVVSGDESTAASGKWGAAAAPFGADQGMFAFGVTGFNYIGGYTQAIFTNNVNTVSNTGVVSSDQSSAAHVKSSAGGAGYGSDKGLFFRGGYIQGTPPNDVNVALNTVNLISNTGVVSADISTAAPTGQSPPWGASYGGDKAVFGLFNYLNWYDYCTVYYIANDGTTWSQSSGFNFDWRYNNTAPASFGS